MFEFKIQSPVGEMSKKFLYKYQARDLPLQIISMRKSNERYNSKMIFDLSVILKTVQSESPIEAGEAVGQVIECMDGNFEVDESCLIHSDILYDFSEGTNSELL